MRETRRLKPKVHYATWTASSVPADSFRTGSLVSATFSGLKSCRGQNSAIATCRDSASRFVTARASKPASIMDFGLNGPRPSVGDGREEMIDDEWAHSVVKYISAQQSSSTGTTKTRVIGTLFAANTASEDGDGTLQVQVGRDL